MNNLPSIIPCPSNYTAYLRFAEGFPMLDADKELFLFNRLISKNDLSAAREIILSHLRLVIKIAREYNGYGLPQEDLIQEGNVGLMKSVKNFNPVKGNRLANYAIFWIKSEIQEYILENWKLIKIGSTKGLKKLFYNYRNIKNKLGLESKESVKIQQIADELNVPESDVITAKEWFDSSLMDINDSYDVLDEARTPEEVCIEKDFEKKRLAILNKEISKLSEKEKIILNGRFYNNRTLLELSKDLCISVERVRQIENLALIKLKKTIPNI